MKILNIKKWLRSVICSSHIWQQKIEEDQRQVKLICEKCGKDKSLAKSEKLFIKIPEKFEREISDK